MGRQKWQVDLSDPGRLWGRVARRIITSDECWRWDGAHVSSGYAVIGVPMLTGPRRMQSFPLHRLLYLLAHPGEMPDEAHHECLNRWCVNPAHIEGISLSDHRKEHPRRIQNPRLTHCQRGHPMEGYNVIVRPDGSRTCRTCANERSNRYSREQSTFHRDGDHKTHCKYGHPWVPENIVTRRDGAHRLCRLCRLRYPAAEGFGPVPWPVRKDQRQ